MTGTLRGGILGPGGETTGWILELPDLDVDMSGIKEPPKMGGSITIAGELQTRSYPVRGRVTTLHATAIAASPAQLSKAGARASIILQGTLATGVIRPGSEGPPYSLTGAAPQIDVSHVKADPDRDKVVRASGSFAAKHYVTIGLRYIFEATALKVLEQPAAPSDPPPPVATSGRVTVTGVSDNLSFDEALHDAIAQLQKQVHIPDFLLDISVDKIAAQVGGIAGFHRLVVTASANVPS
ncbi:MAG TPA: hypothetical protein VGM88_17270 [Kofleriaceae bacterium]